MKQYYFISGLPRSGSTLLSAILKQNPEFYSDILSPVLKIVVNTIEELTFCDNSFNIDEYQRETILKNIFDGYYCKNKQNVIFDTSRLCTLKTPLLKKLFPYTKIICCVREVSWILDSFERIIAKNPYYLNTIVDYDMEHTVISRCESLMSEDKGGQIIKALLSLQEGLAINPKMIYLVEYDELCKTPEKIIKNIYDFIEKPYYQHDFNNIEYSNNLFDLKCNLKDLHTVKRKVEYVQKNTILPLEIFNKYQKFNFWKNKTINYQ
jgi:sulfotransferase